MNKLIAFVASLCLLLGVASAELDGFAAVLTSTPNILPMRALIDGCFSAVDSPMEELESIGFEKSGDVCVFEKPRILGLNSKYVQARPLGDRNEIKIHFDFSGDDDAFESMMNLESIIYQEYGINPASVIVDGKFTSYSNARSFIRYLGGYDDFEMWFEIDGRVFNLIQHDSTIDMYF